MDRLFDLFLSVPLSDLWAQALLFFTFSLHLTFVLFLLGTALIGIYYLGAGRAADREPNGGKSIHKAFIALKSLAVVLGVGPLLLIQVNYTVPFFNAAGLYAPYWMLIIALLIFSFTLFDSLYRKDERRPAVRIASLIALVVLLAVPAIFVLILSTAEYPDRWFQIIKNDFRPDGELSVHLLFRYVHILGAAVIFGAVFHYFFQNGDAGNGKKSMLRWLFTGLLIQFAVGPMLAVSVLRRIGFLPGLFLLIGVVSAAMLARTVFRVASGERILKSRTTALVLAVLFLSMLLVRQLLQAEGFFPLVKRAEQARAAYEEKIDRYRPGAIEAYKAHLGTVYDNGKTIYAGSCAFCHGEKGDGKGTEAGNLSIPPADLTAIRAGRDYLYGSIAEGVPGSAMPYFSVFDREKLASLMDYLDRNFKTLGSPEPLTRAVSPGAMQTANRLFTTACAQCHGADGKGRTEAAKGLAPRPPDFSVYSLTPEEAFEVITNGYRGTAMPPFASLPEEVRWGLVKVVAEKRTVKR